MEKKYWTLEDYQKLINNLKVNNDEYYKELITVMLEIVWHARVRKCHLYALRWSDVDFDNRVLCVRSSVSPHRKTKNYFLFENEASKKIKMDEKLTETLKKWKKTQSRYLLYDDGFVISFFGLPIRSDKIERYIREQAENLGFESFSVDMLRQSSIISECMYGGKGLVETWLDSQYTFSSFAKALSPAFNLKELKSLMRNEYVTQNRIRSDIGTAVIKKAKNRKESHRRIKKEYVPNPKRPMISSKDFYESGMNARKVKATIGVIKADMINEGYSEHGIVELKEFPVDKVQKGTVFRAIESNTGQQNPLLK